MRSVSEAHSAQLINQRTTRQQCPVHFQESVGYFGPMLRAYLGILRIDAHTHGPRHTHMHWRS